MQVQIEKVESKDQELAVIKAVEITDEISGAIELLEGDAKGFAVSKDGKTYIIKASAVYYIESVDNKTFIYTKGKVYESRQRLYELEEVLPDNFERISKSAIANWKKIAKFRVQLSGAVDAVFQSGYVECISRRCFAELKRRYGL